MDAGLQRVACGGISAALIQSTMALYAYLDLHLHSDRSVCSHRCSRRLPTVLHNAQILN